MRPHAVRASYRTMPEPPQSRLVPVLILAGIVAAGLLAVWLFPIFQGWVAHQDCVAAGRTDCGF